MSKKRTAAGTILLIIGFLGLLAFHIYVVYFAFISWGILWGIVTFCAPVVAELIIGGIMIGSGIWIPVVLGLIATALFGVGSALVEHN